MESCPIRQHTMSLQRWWTNKQHDPVVCVLLSFCILQMFLQSVLCFGWCLCKSDLELGNACCVVTVLSLKHSFFFDEAGQTLGWFGKTGSEWARWFTVIDGWRKAWLRLASFLCLPSALTMICWHCNTQIHQLDPWSVDISILDLNSITWAYICLANERPMEEIKSLWLTHFLPLHGLFICHCFFLSINFSCCFTCCLKWRIILRVLTCI